MATLTSASDYLEVKLLDLVFNGTTYTPPSNVYLALYTSAPSDAGGGTEVSGGSYARQALSFAAASGRTATTDADTLFTAVPAGDVTHFGILDASTSGNLLWWGEVDAAVDPAGDDYKVSAGGLSVVLAYGSTSGISETLANALLDHVLRSASWSPGTAVEVGLFDGTGTEVTGGAYARDALDWSAASSGSTATSTAGSWTIPSSVTVAELRAFLDAASGGDHLWSWEITPKAFTAGSEATAAVGALTATID